MSLYEFGITNYPRHKVFISYHHALDQEYRDRFENLFARVFEIMVSKSVQIGDIHSQQKTDNIRRIIREDYLSDSTVTIVLVGANTWSRKHVDWEIGVSLNDTDLSPRSGLLGIILPSYPRSDLNEYDTHTIPPRLYDNIQCGFAKIYNWSTNPTEVQQWIHEAFVRRKTVKPNNARASFGKNWKGEKWQG